MIDKDIEIVKNLIKYLQLKIDSGDNKIIYNEDFYEEKTVDCIQAIENVLADRETWKKIAEKSAEELAGNDDYVQNIIEWARKEVDKNESIYKDKR